jgi:hypothetical protein
MNRMILAGVTGLNAMFLNIKKLQEIIKQTKYLTHPIIYDVA